VRNNFNGIFDYKIITRSLPALKIKQHIGISRFFVNFKKDFYCFCEDFFLKKNSKYLTKNLFGLLLSPQL